MYKSMNNTISRGRVVDACATVRARKHELAHPAYYFTSVERATVRLNDAYAELGRAVEACPEHNAPLNLG